MEIIYYMVNTIFDSSNDVPQSHEGILSSLSDEINRLSGIREDISQEKISPVSFGVLIGICFLNILLIAVLKFDYLFFWVASSLYFYLFYPMLPLFLFPFRMIYQKATGTAPIKKKSQSMVTWAKNLHIFSNKRIGYNLFMRFFLLSMIPITYGVLCIYGISITFTMIIGYFSNFSNETLFLILIQCMGIILFYSEIFLFKGRMLYNTHIRLQSKIENHKRLVFMAIIACVLILLSTVLVILMIIAMVLPAFTLTKFVNMAGFYYAGRSITVVFLLCSQFVIMQFLQSILSRKIAYDMVDQKYEQLTDAQKIVLTSETTHMVSCLQRIESLVLESRLYAYNRRKMLGLYPSYSIGVNIPVLLSINNLKSLQDIFLPDQKSME